MQKFLKEACDCNVSKATISRQLKKITKEDRQLGRVKRLKARAKMAAEGRNFDFTVSSTTSRSASASVAPPDQNVAAGELQQQSQEQQHQPQQQQNQPRQILPPGQKELPQLQQRQQAQPSSHRQTQAQPEARFESFQPLGGDFPTPEQALLSLSRTQPQQGPPPSLAQQQAGTV